ncbi:MAG: hypothetical protein R2855_00375 [Thermomicrobiales bacterium]
MLAFVLLASRAGQPISTETLTHAAAKAAPVLPFLPEVSLCWANRSGTITVLAWQALTENASIGSHWHVDREGGLTLFSGHCWPRDTGWDAEPSESWAEQLARWLDRHSALDAHEELFGFYTLVRLDPDGAGSVTTDLLGAGQLFTGDSSRWTAISNRAGLAAAAANDFDSDPERDPLAMGWLAFWGSSLGDDSGYWDAARAPFNSQITTTANASVKIEPRPRPFWHRPGPNPTTGDYPSLLDEIDADLRSTLRAIMRLPTREFELRLSGGKDSRLLTALLFDEGLHERVRFLTHGLPSHADARSASLIAERLSLDWSMDDRSQVSLEEEERRLLRHTFLVEGVTNGWDSAGVPTALQGVSLSGIGGECTKFGPTATAGLSATSIADVKRIYAEKEGFDPARVLTTDARRHFHAVVDDWIDAQAALHQEPSRIPSLFITQQRTRSWSGPSRAVKPNLWLGPFLIPSYIRFRQLLPLADRANPRVHLDLLRRCRVDLSTIPLANDTWPEGAMSVYPDADQLRAIAPMRSLPGPSAGWRTARADELRPMLGAYLADRTNPIYEVVDYTAVQRLLKSRKITGQGLRVLYGVATGAIWLAHRETPVHANADWTAGCLPI